MSFIEGGNSITGGAAPSRIAYYFDRDNKTIMRRVGNSSPESIVSKAITINRADFFVTGTEPQSVAGDTDQPTVTIIIEATDTAEPTTAPFIVQTTITQRELDL